MESIPKKEKTEQKEKKIGWSTRLWNMMKEKFDHELIINILSFHRNMKCRLVNKYLAKNYFERFLIYYPQYLRRFDISDNKETRKVYYYWVRKESWIKLCKNEEIKKVGDKRNIQGMTRDTNNLPEKREKLEKLRRLNIQRRRDALNIGMQALMVQQP